MGNVLDLNNSLIIKERTVREEISVRLYPNKELREFFRLLISQMACSDKGTGKMTINFSQFSPVSIDWRDACGK